MQRFMLALVVVGALLLRPDMVASQGYPTRQIHLIVTFPPGGNADTVARLVADKLTQQLGQSVIVREQARRRFDRRDGCGRPGSGRRLHLAPGRDQYVHQSRARP